MAQATGPENNGSERTFLNLLAGTPVNSPTRITLENNGKFWPKPGPEKLSLRASGGARGIRTLETVPRLHTFQACAFDHSATAPSRVVYTGRCDGFKGKRGQMRRGGGGGASGRPCRGRLRAQSWRGAGGGTGCGPCGRWRFSPPRSRCPRWRLSRA